MTNNKIKIPIKGMHCSACEILTEQELAKLPGVLKVKSDHKTGFAEIEYADKAPDESVIRQAVSRSGYQYGQEKLSFISKTSADYVELLYAVIIFMALYWVLSLTGLLESNSVALGSNMTWPIILMIGLTAGFSTCMALVGGLVLGLAANYAKANQGLSVKKKIVPHLVFNAGRIIGYAILGALLGILGNAIKLSTVFNGFLVIAVALFMIVLGLKLLKIFPKFERFNLALPKSVARILPLKLQDKTYSHYRTALLGALTFFVPCGFTQAMQVYALSSGNGFTGALTMGLFAIGTAPGLLSLAGLVSLVKGKMSGIFFRLAGLAVIAFAIFNLTNGYNLVKAGGVDLLSWINSGNDKGGQSSNSSNENGIQVIRMTQASRGYSPNKFTVELGRSVKWIITSTNPRSCASALIVPKLNISKQLEEGENIIEFTPTEVGPINFSCSMGMYTGVINVIDASEASVEEKVSVDLDATPSSTHVCDGSCGAGSKGCSAGKSGSGCDGSCGCGAKQTAVKEQKITPSSQEAEVYTKVYTAVYTLDRDIVPNEFRTKVGQPTRIDILAKEGGEGCMQDILIQGLAEEPQYLAEGKTISLSFTPQAKGTYLIVCAMNIPRGKVIVE